MRKKLGDLKVGEYFKGARYVGVMRVCRTFSSSVYYSDADGELHAQLPKDKNTVVDVVSADGTPEVEWVQRDEIKPGEWFLDEEEGEPMQAMDCYHLHHSGVAVEPLPLCRQGHVLHHHYSSTMVIRIAHGEE